MEPTTLAELETACDEAREQMRVATIARDRAVDTFREIHGRVVEAQRAHYAQKAAA